MPQQQSDMVILIVDDEANNLEALATIVSRQGYQTLTARSAAEALQMLEKQAVQLVITDLVMPQMDGLQLVQRIKSDWPLTEVIVVTAHATIESAVAAIRYGAYDFIAKPFDRASILRQLDKALEKQQLLQENQELRAQLTSLSKVYNIVGQSTAIRKMVELIDQVADSEATVLILGESGTGKELVAHALHVASRRSTAPFVKVSCTTIPDTLLEAELFGYERGAFTGAHQRREGRYETADHGTLFLDEIGDLPLTVQGKLLRVLQEGEFERLGSNRTLSVNVRVVAATNCDLRELVQQGKFREDLFYRLNVLEIQVPALRERFEDVPLLAQHFLQLSCKRNHKALLGIHEAALQQLLTYDWPGNVRELENFIERAVVLAQDKQLQLNDLSMPTAAKSTSTVNPGSLLTVPFGTPMAEIEKGIIKETLRQTHGDKKRAADMLGIASRTIYRKLKEC